MTKNVKAKMYDRRRKYYLILDCETATLPYSENFSGKARKDIAIAKPLIYDLGWQVIDRTGKVYSRKSYLISEIFSVPSIFNTAYYASKRPIYLERLERKEITLTDWNTAVNALIWDMKQVQGVGAYNSMFDFKKAIPFTESYIKALYSSDFYKWEKNQKISCDNIANGIKSNGNDFEKNVFRFRNEKYSLFDVWGLSCQHILNNDDYREMCYNNNWITPSGKYYKTSAETCYRYYKGNTDFMESHTAIEDAEIESEIFSEILKRTKNKFEYGIIYFPFKIIGKIEID